MNQVSELNPVIDQVFRRESGKIISVLTRIFGVENIDMAEDVMQDSMLEAINTWQKNGIPDNPSGWLYTVAKNKALNILNKEKSRRGYSSDVSHYLQSVWTAEPALEHLFSEREIRDDQLRMIFTCCHPAVSPDSQIALALKTLCGFGIPEIAKAFLTTEENINKRLVRARQKIREARLAFEVPRGKELEKRLNTVLETIYLLFNEGYSASKGRDIIRYELCEEAMHLAGLIAAENTISEKGNVYALLALMLLNASRFRARQNSDGRLLTLAEQDRKLWDKATNQQGLNYLQQAAENNKIGTYHILAAISATYNSAADFESTDWKSILSLYDQLILVDSSPLILLNRAIALFKVYGAVVALQELKQIENEPLLKSYLLFYATQAEFYIELNQLEKAADSLATAISLATVPAEKVLLQNKLDSCYKKIF